MGFKEKRKQTKELRERIYRPRTRGETAAMRRARAQAVATILVMALIVAVCVCVILFRRSRPTTEPTESSSAPIEPPDFTVILDPGHGGADAGNAVNAQTCEADYVMDVALQARDLLEEQNCAVRFTRDAQTEAALSDEERLLLCIGTGADCMISLHTCGREGSRYSLLTDTTERSALLAQCIGNPEAESEEAVTRLSGIPCVRLGLSGTDSVQESAESIVNGILTYREKLGS